MNHKERQTIPVRDTNPSEEYIPVRLTPRGKAVAALALTAALVGGGLKAASNNVPEVPASVQQGIEEHNKLQQLVQEPAREVQYIPPASTAK